MALDIQQDTFMLLPNFRYQPEKNIRLGSLLARQNGRKTRPDPDMPLNKTTVELIPPEDILTEKEPVNFNGNNGKHSRYGIFADIPTLSAIGGELGFGKDKGRDLLIDCGKVEVQTFKPDSEYLWRASKSADLSDMEAKENACHAVRCLQHMLSFYQIHSQEDILHKPDPGSFAPRRFIKPATTLPIPDDSCINREYAHQGPAVRRQLNSSRETLLSIRSQHGSDEGQTVNNPQREAAAAWLKNHESTQSFLAETRSQARAFRKTKLPRIKVAILDTGVRFTKETARLLYGSRLKECRTWCDAEKPNDGRECDDDGEDTDGHGTHCASMLLDIDKTCDVYIAKIHDSSVDREIMLSSTIDARIANAIKYARETWGVDIISMSFGYRPHPYEFHTKSKTEIQKCSHGPLLLAAASNDGGNTDPTFPASCQGVLPVYATDGFGNAYFRNPKGVTGKQKYATLGCEVPGWSDPALGTKVTKSGTSVATPTIAGIAASIMSFIDLSKEGYIAALPEQDRENESMLFERNRQALRTQNGMEAVLKLMVAAPGAMNSTGLEYIEPWILLKTPKSGRSLALNKIIGVLTDTT